jgi:hypothetical protein
MTMTNAITPPVLNSLQQKLVTVYLDNTSYAKGKMIVGTFGDKHGLIEEHLAAFLQEGWRVAKIEGIGGGSDSLAVRGWIAVLLERNPGG